MGITLQAVTIRIPPFTKGLGILKSIWRRVHGILGKTERSEAGCWRRQKSGQRNARHEREEKLLLAVTALEFVHSSAGIHDFLLAGIKRMAGGTHVQMNFVFGVGGSGSELVAAATFHVDFMVFGMNIWPHERNLVFN
jgi:hypothetical protein